MDDLLRVRIGDELRLQRNMQGRSLKEVAAEAQIAYGYLSEIERGMKDPSSEILESVCAALHFTVLDFIRGIIITADLEIKVETSYNSVLESL